MGHDEKLFAVKHIIIRDKIETEAVAANSNANLLITNIAPTAVGTSSISKWLKVTQGGTEYYIPMWT